MTDLKHYSHSCEGCYAIYGGALAPDETSYVVRQDGWLFLRNRLTWCPACLAGWASILNPCTFPSHDIGGARIAIAVFPDDSAQVDVFDPSDDTGVTTFTATHDEIRALAHWLIEQVG